MIQVKKLFAVIRIFLSNQVVNMSFGNAMRSNAVGEDCASDRYFPIRLHRRHIKCQGAA